MLVIPYYVFEDPKLTCVSVSVMVYTSRLLEEGGVDDVAVVSDVFFIKIIDFLIFW